MASSLFDQLIGSGGFVRFDRLATVAAGVLAGSIASGISAVIEGIFTAFFFRPLAGAAAWIDAVISGTFGALTGGIAQAGAQGEAFVATFGVLAAPVALAIGLGGLGAIAYAVNRIREDE